MDNAFARNSFVSTVPQVDKFARHFVQTMTSADSLDSKFGSVEGIEGDELSFAVKVYRKTIRFEFKYVFLSLQNGTKLLSGGYSVFLVDRKGEWLPEQCQLVFFSDQRSGAIRFDEEYYEFSWEPSAYESSELRDKVKKLALKIAQTDMPTIKY